VGDLAGPLTTALLPPTLRGVTDANPLGTYLRARRELVTPEEAGLVARAPGRRVPGLRREEVATLAGISVEYLTRLERGKDRSPSRQVLDAVASVLRLDNEAHRYLYSLAWPAGGPGRPPLVEKPVPAMTRALARLDDGIAYVLNPYLDVVASTRVAQAFLGPAGRGNQVEYLFLDPAARTTYPGWDAVAREAVSALRSSAGEHRDDQRLIDLVGRLSTQSEDFRTIWARHDTHGNTSGTKRIVSDLYGEITIHWDAFSTAYPTGQTLVLYSADPDSPDAQRLQQVRRSLDRVGR
jgi:transcriptional regulator with XRE-family HTH domain